MIDPAQVFYGTSTYSPATSVSSISCQICQKLKPLFWVVSAGELDGVQSGGVSTMFKMAEAFGLGFVCSGCKR